jgi:hypothetical protein
MVSQYEELRYVHYLTGRGSNKILSQLVFLESFFISLHNDLGVALDSHADCPLHPVAFFAARHVSGD